jgi:PmbA protein
MKDYMLRLSEEIFRSLDKVGVEEAEFYGEWGRLVNIDVSAGNIEKISVKDIGSYGVRGSIGRRVAGISVEDLSANPVEIAEKLANIIRASPEDKNWPGFAKGYSRGVPSRIFDEKLANASIENMVERLKNYMSTSIEAALRNGGEESTVSEGTMIYGTGGAVIANSDGEHLYDEYTSIVIYYDVKSRKDGEEASFSAMYTGRRLDEDAILREASRGGEYSVKFMKARPVDTGEYQLLLDPYMAALFAETLLSPAFSALNVQENRSPLKGKLGSRVVSEHLTIRDDPSIDWGVGSRSFDDEGQPTTRKNIIESGILETYLYDHYTASREGRRSTGNGFRRNPGSPPSPAPTNLVFDTDKPWGWDDLVSGINKGIIVHGMIGYWMSSPVSGSAQATVSHGLLVENGVVKRPVKGIVIGGNIYDWLGRDLIGVGRDLVAVERIYSRKFQIKQLKNWKI